ncbi:Uncharacterised protein [Bordetella pertussis]|nr:Uncharacterised protein [Bordetella pertussis]
MGAISSANSPSATLRCARRTLSCAYASCCSREKPYSRAARSA